MKLPSTWTHLVLLAGMCSGCQDLTASADYPPLDRNYFDCEVNDVITKTCAGLRCHGDAARYYAVFTRNRLRYGVSEDERGSPLRTTERDHNFAATLAQVDLEDRSESLLLLKPLEESAGGYFHRGAEIFGGGDVFRDREDRDFKKLVAWLEGETAEPDCDNGGSAP